MLAIMSELSCCLVLVSVLGLWIGILAAQENCTTGKRETD